MVSGLQGSGSAEKRVEIQLQLQLHHRLQRVLYKKVYPKLDQIHRHLPDDFDIRRKAQVPLVLQFLLFQMQTVIACSVYLRHHIVMEVVVGGAEEEAEGDPLVSDNLR